MIKYLDDFMRGRARQIEELTPSLHKAIGIILELEAAFKSELTLTGSRFFNFNNFVWTDVDYYMATSKPYVARKNYQWLLSNGFVDVTEDTATDMSVNQVFELIIDDVVYCTVLLIKPEMLNAKDNAQKRIQDTLHKGEIGYRNISWMTWNALIATELGVLVTPKPSMLTTFLQRFKQ